MFSRCFVVVVPRVDVFLICEEEGILHILLLCHLEGALPHLFLMVFSTRARTPWWLLTGVVMKITTADGRQLCGYLIHSLQRLKLISFLISILSSFQFCQSKSLYILVPPPVFFLDSSCTHSVPQEWCVNEWGPL